ncbi:hypothetical protein [Gracilimonas tropica]|uniref:hypothetical protein n=1 Tax=Gracilimonas tropica TaxID=454600 RepID=UPI00037D8AAD|nr:hypothetical protein [Gracilimonas tropica]
MKKLYIYILFPFLIILACCRTVTAQPSSPQFDRGWFSFGLGQDFSTNKEINGRLAGSLTINWGRNKFWQAGYSANSEILGTTHFSAIHAGRGISSVNRWFRVSAAGGPAFIWGRENDHKQQKKINFYSAGIVGDAQLFFTPVKEMGIGVQFSGNLNFKHPLGGYRLIIVIEGHK